VRLISFDRPGDRWPAPRIGVVRDAAVFDLAADPALPATMVELVALGDEGLARAAAVADATDPADALALDAVRVRAAIRPRNNVMAIGKNYVEHAAEFSRSGFDVSEQTPLPEHPIVFTKALSSIVGPGDAVDVSADVTGTSDYEGELGVVIGPGGIRIAAADAWDHVFGYTIVNDVTVRELQRRHVQFFVGKSADTYCPMGPCIVTRDEIPDIGACWLRTHVNGEERQAAPIADLIFDIPTLIAAISAAVRLEPGDVIATGTPAGVGIGRKPPTYLAPGDVVEVSIDGIGTLRNPVT
jgi:2-keto-4-pentenoate hydratase/2-oxohepta-3-ene-1,7-dioic acid hydratase in catechol pathway